MYAGDLDIEDHTLVVHSLVRFQQLVHSFVDRFRDTSPDNMGGSYLRAANCFPVIKVSGRFIDGFDETWMGNTYLVVFGKGGYDTIVPEVF